PPRPARSDGFFSWTAGLGVVRGDGWLGGVAAGLAARMRVDPLIVRGILVVIGLFGFPVLFVYAVAWALLPDLDGRIPLQQALRGQLTPALAGAAACALLGLVPAPLPLILGAPTLWSVAGGSVSALGILFFLFAGAVAAGLIVIVTRAAIRTSSERPDAAAPGLRTASADPASAAAPDPLDPSSRSLSERSESKRPSPDQNPDTADPTAAEYAAWREQHAAWKIQDDAWRRQQQDAARIAREQARRERQERATAFSTDAAERRRIRRLTKPRTPFAFVAIVIGIALIAGTATALQHGGELAIAVGMFVGALVLALAMMVAGALRRRSGFLAFATVATLVGGAVSLAVPTVSNLHLGDYGISNLGSQSYPAAAPFTQPWGNLNIYLADTGRNDQPISVVKRSGSTLITLDTGVELRLDLTAQEWATTVTDREGNTIDLASLEGMHVDRLGDGRTRYRGTLRADDGAVTTQQTLVIDQESGWIGIDLLGHAEQNGYRQ
ncbi:PspC domain-containing protein, partial [Microbacterium sp.]|uniref:PspC domain-containing protein n=1 Tax=Microbacterium sp. TaxID=51671 RepID=UPI003C784928